MIIGLTGKNASGKGEVASYLKSKGFIYYSLSDVIRDEATKRRLSHSRENLIKLGNDLRQNNSPNFLAEQINLKIKESSSKGNAKNFVIDSIRSPHEAKELMKNESFTLVGVDSPIEIRFRRLLSRNRIGDAKTLQAFKQQEAKENTTNENSQQLDKTFKLSQKKISNNGPLQDLHKKIDELIS
jgi:dephospho-CoA kinase